MAVKKYQILQKRANDNLVMHPETDASIVVLDNSSGHYQGEATNVQNALEEVYGIASQVGSNLVGRSFVNGVATDVNFTSDPQTQINSSLSTGTNALSQIGDLSSQIGDLETLSTTNKTSLVNAINEVKNSSGAGGGLEEIVLFERINNNGTSIYLNTSSPINLKNYGLVGDLKDYKYLVLTYSDGDYAFVERETVMIRLDQPLLSGQYNYYDYYSVFLPRFYYVDSSKYAVGNYELELNTSNQIKYVRGTQLFGDSSSLSVLSKSSVYINNIALLK